MESQRTQVVEEGVSIEEVVLLGEGSAEEDQLSSLLAKAYLSLAMISPMLVQSLIVVVIVVVVVVVVVVVIEVNGQ